jgi:hypothetical protein
VAVFGSEKANGREPGARGRRRGGSAGHSVAARNGAAAAREGGRRRGPRVGPTGHREREGRGNWGGGGWWAELAGRVRVFLFFLSFLFKNINKYIFK